MKTFTVTLEWNEQSKKWLMFLGDRFIYDFWDCQTVHNAFEELNIKEKKTYKICIEKLGVLKEAL